MSLKPVMKEQAEIYRIRRGHSSQDEKLKFETPRSIQKNYPHFTKNMTPVELEMFWEDMKKRVSL